MLLDALPEAGFEAGTLTAAAHRVVHGGRRLTAPMALSDDAIAKIRQMVPLAPLHNPPALAGIEALSDLRPGLPWQAIHPAAMFAQRALVQGLQAVFRVHRSSRGT